MEGGPWSLFTVSKQCRLDGFKQQYQFNGNKHLFRTILLADVEPDDRVARGGGGNNSLTQNSLHKSELRLGREVR